MQLDVQTIQSIREYIQRSNSIISKQAAEITRLNSQRNELHKKATAAASIDMLGELEEGLSKEAQYEDAELKTLRPSERMLFERLNLLPASH
jgi:hypothetical protein